MEQVILKIRGMFGEHCERAITDSLSHIESVTDVVIKERAGTISFCHDPKIAPLIKIKDAITDEGYDVIG
jgi:copper chaperone CopZ